MDDIRKLMIRLDGADPETVNRIAWECGSLPVRLAMLGLASTRKGESPLWRPAVTRRCLGGPGRGEFNPGRYAEDRCGDGFPEWNPT